MAFLADVETAITSQLGTISAASFGLADAARPAFITGLTIWILLTGYEVAYGKTQDSVAYILTKLGKMILLGYLALFSWSDVSSLLSGLKDAAVGSTGGAAAALDAAIFTPLEGLWTRMYGDYNTVSGPILPHKIGQIFTLALGFLFLLFSYILTVICAGLLAIVTFALFMVAQATFAVLLALGPFFILCLIFPFTQKFFEAYIGTVMTSIFALALTAIVLNLGSSILGLQNIVTNVGAPDGSVEGYMVYARDAAVALVAKAGAALLTTYIAFKIFDLAAALGGGMNMGNNLVGGVRAIVSDLASNGSKSKSPTSNSISSGGGGGGGGGASQRAAGANSTLTGAAVRGAAALASPAARLAASGVSNMASIASYGAGRAAGAVGKFAYNRYSQNRNRISAS